MKETYPKMKRAILFFLLAAVCIAVSAAEPLKPVRYTDPANWAVYTPADKADKPFDVFYVYPTLVLSRDVPLMQWDKKTKTKTVGFAEAQLSGFMKYANVYCPYVRQLEFTRCIKELESGFKTEGAPEESMAAGASDTIEALQYYLTHLNRGRPYILLGHSQGSYDLAIALSRNGNIRTDFGFVAAYLIGMPFYDRKFAPHPFAAGADDVGVIVSWNTQSPDAGKSLFSGKGAYCINPLNWRTDATPAKPEENPGAMFYDYETRRYERIPNYCGAVIDPEKGALIALNVPESKFTKLELLGKGVWHMNDLWFFYDALVANARLRVSKWMQLHPDPAVPSAEK